MSKDGDAQVKAAKAREAKVDAAIPDGRCCTMHTKNHLCSLLPGVTATHTSNGLTCTAHKQAFCIPPAAVAPLTCISHHNKIKSVLQWPTDCDARYILLAVPACSFC